MWWRLVFKEILKRKWGFLFSALAVAIAIGVLGLIASITLSMKNEARMIGRRMGQNILIVPADLPLNRYHLGDFGDHGMPERVLERLIDPKPVVVVDQIADPENPGKTKKRLRVMDREEAAKVTRSEVGGRLYKYTLPQLADHYSAELQVRREATAGGGAMDVVLTGQRKEEGRKKRKPLTVPPEPGQAFVGATVAAGLNLKKGSALEVLGRSFRVAKVAKPEGTIDDIRVFIALADAQEMLGKKGQINRVMALGCLCDGLEIGEVARILQSGIDQWRVGGLPVVQTRVIPMRRIANAREQMRLLVIKTAQYLTPLLAVICAALVGGYFYFNVRERQHEMGIMLAIGFRPAPILAAILLKLVLIALVGFGAGFYGGIYLAMRLGPSIRITRVIAAWDLWPLALGGALALTLLAGLYPLIVAARTEAARILRNP